MLRDRFDFSAARRQHCPHARIVDTDPLSVRWPRGWRCLTCAAEIVDLTPYVVHDGTVVRSLRTEGRTTHG
jgi:hypothetical protein